MILAFTQANTQGDPMKKTLVLLSISLLSLQGMAETNIEKETETEKAQSTAKIQKWKGEEKADKADELITNRRFRASNGSLSKYSMNMSLSYSGSSLSDPFAADRPNISNAGDTTSIAGINGAFNGSYRINSLNRINLGAGLQMLAPLNKTIDTDDPRAQKEFDDNQGELDVSNPFISYTHMNKFFGVQTIATATLRQYTASNLTDVGYQNEIAGSLNTMYNVGKTGFSFGALMLYSKYFFNKDDEAFLGSQNDVVFGFLPQAEYVINDTFNLRTIIRSHWYQNTNANRDFEKRPVTQSVGLGISVSRDVFLYPNIQFAYDNLAADNTNVGLTANINMF